MNFNFPNQHRLFPVAPVVPKSLTDLPPEISYEIFKLVPNELRHTCRHFYIAYNDMYCEKIVAEMGSHALYVIAVHSLPYIVKYVRSFDYWKRTQREIIARHYDLPDYEEDIQIRKMLSPSEVVHCKYVKDSWRLVYSLIKNRRLFPEYSDYEVDEPESYLYRNMLRINKTYLVKYNKQIKLSPDIYNLSCGIIVQSAMGLGTMKFQVFDHITGKELLTYFPPTNIDELVPRDKFVILDIGNFTVESIDKETYGTIQEEDGLDDDDDDDDDNNNNYNNNDAASTGITEDALSRLDREGDKMVEIDILMEECGLNLKSGFTICYIDINAYPDEAKRTIVGTNKKPKQIVPDSRWIFWSIDNQEPTAENVVNVLLKNVDKSINEGFNFKRPPSVHERVGSYAQSIRRRSSILSRRRRSSVGSFASGADTSIAHLNSPNLTNNDQAIEPQRSNELTNNTDYQSLINSISYGATTEDDPLLINSESEVVSIHTMDDDQDTRDNINQMRPTTIYRSEPQTSTLSGDEINSHSYYEDDEIDPNISKDVVSIYSSDGTDFIDVDNYNRQFFNVYNQDGEVITRTIKFLTVLDKREYEAELVRDGVDAHKVDTEAPLKWKLGTMFNL